MASELYVETLKGLTSGANANKVIIPSGQTLDASAGTTHISVPYFIVSLVSSQNMPNTSYTKVAFNTAIADPDNIWDTTNYWWDVTDDQAGIWQINVNLKTLDGNAVRNIIMIKEEIGNTQFAYVENGQSSASSSSRSTTTANLLIEVSSGQRVSIYFYHDYGSAINLNGAASDLRTAVSAFKIAGPSS